MSQPLSPLTSSLLPPTGQTQPEGRARAAQVMQSLQLSLQGTAQGGGEWRVDLKG